MAKQTTPTDKTPEHVPEVTPRVTPADLGEFETTGAWQQKKQTDAPAPRKDAR